MEIYRNKRVFITGHSGFKGSWLTLWLESLGAEVFGYALPPNTNPSHFALLKEKGALKCHSSFSDICDKNALSSAIKDANPHIIFHLAAQPLVRESYQNPSDTFKINALGTLNVLDLARNLPHLRAIVAITTDKVYENKEWLWGYRENDALGGYDPYSASKACAEIIIASFRASFFNPRDFGKTHNILLASARAGNVIGGGDWSEDRIIPDLMRGIAQNRATNIRNPHATRPWQFVLEPLRGYLMLGARLLNNDTTCATSFNFGPNLEANLSVESLLKKCKNAWDKIAFHISRESQNAPHEANLLMLDSTKAHAMLDFAPFYSVEVAINRTIEWYRAFIENGEILSEAILQDYIQSLQNINGGGESLDSSDFFSHYFIFTRESYHSHNLSFNLSLWDSCGALPQPPLTFKKSKQKHTNSTALRFCDSRSRFYSTTQNLAA